MALPVTYNLRNLVVRRLSTALTFAVITVVVAVLCILLSFAAGIGASLKASGSPRNIIIIQPGATAESTSFVRPDETARIIQTPGVARGDGGRLLISEELCVQTSIPRRNEGGGTANVAVRGVDEIALAVHPEVMLTEGRMFEQGALEVVVGAQARDRFEGLDIGGTVIMGRGDKRFQVVGVFESGSGALESEIWAPRTMVADVYERRIASSVYVRLEDPSLADAAIEYVSGPTVRLNPRRETDYYEDLSTKTAEIVGLTTVLIAIMGIGAVFAVANTMYASVDNRRREIAMLRTIGFGRWSMLVSFLFESLLICGAGCLAGIAASFFFNGSRKDFLSDATWTVLAYELRITPQIIGTALGVSLLVGLIGGMAPALRASRVKVIEALRKA